MKLLATCLIFLLASLQLTAQKIDSVTMAKLSLQQQEEVKAYLRQSKNAKTTGVLMAMGGGSVAIAGVAYSIAYDVNNADVLYGPSYNNGTKIAILGAMVGLTSIPFFIMSNSRRDAVRAILYADRAVSLAPQVLIPGSQSAGIRLVIPLGR